MKLPVWLATGTILMLLGAGTLVADAWPQAMNSAQWLAFGALLVQVPLWLLVLALSKNSDSTQQKAPTDETG